MKTGFGHSQPMAAGRPGWRRGPGPSQASPHGGTYYLALARRENLTMLVGEQLVGYSLAGDLPRPLGNRHPTACHTTRTVARATTAGWSSPANPTSSSERSARSRSAPSPPMPHVSQPGARARKQLGTGPRDRCLDARGRPPRSHMHLLQRAGPPADAVLTTPERWLFPTYWPPARVSSTRTLMPTRGRRKRCRGAFPDGRPHGTARAGFRGIERLRLP